MEFAEGGRAAALAHVSLGLAAVWVTAPGEGGPRALGGVATLTPLFEPLGRPLLLVLWPSLSVGVVAAGRPVWAALPGVARALSSFPLPYLPFLSSRTLVLYCMYCNRGGSWDAVGVLDSREHC